MNTITATVPRVADAMVRHPCVHGPATTVGELRAFFDDDHVHMALLVEAGALIGVVERTDLQLSVDDSAPASAIATLDGKTVRAGAAVADVFAMMKRDGRRRLAVTGDRSVLLGLLCLKRSGLGFCSDADLSARSG